MRLRHVAVLAVGAPAGCRGGRTQPNDGFAGHEVVRQSHRAAGNRRLRLTDNQVVVRRAAVGRDAHKVVAISLNLERFDLGCAERTVGEHFRAVIQVEVEIGSSRSGDYQRDDLAIDQADTEIIIDIPRREGTAGRIAGSGPVDESANADRVGDSLRRCERVVRHERRIRIVDITVG